MNPAQRSRRTVDFADASRFSKVPRWCQSKTKTEPPLRNLGSCLGRNNAMDSVVKMPPIYSIEELTGICEPPSLQKDTLQAVWKAKSRRQEVDDRLKETVAHADFLKQQLKQVKEEIEKISRQLESPDLFLEFAEENEVEDPCEFLAKNNLELQQLLLKCVGEEENLTVELENAHRQVWEARVADNLLAVDIERTLTPAIQAYDKRKEFMMQKRAFRENLATQNASRLQSKFFHTAMKAVMESDAAKMKRKAQMAQKLQGAKEGRKRIEHHIKKTMQTIKEQKLLHVCDLQLKQDRQHMLLSNLKKEIDEQRDALEVKNQARKKRLQNIAEEKARIRQEFFKHGKNPYFVEHLLVIVDRRAELQRKILQKETERLVQLQKDYEITEKAKKAEELNKLKWDKFWAKQLSEKKRKNEQKEAALLHDDDKNKSESNYKVKNVNPDATNIVPSTTAPIVSPPHADAAPHEKHSKQHDAKVSTSRKESGPQRTDSITSIVDHEKNSSHFRKPRGSLGAIKTIDGIHQLLKPETQ